MKRILLSLMIVFSIAAGAQSITAITPTQAYRGDSLQTTITSSGLFLVGSSPQNNIQDIFLRNGSGTLFAVADSTHALSTITATTFWRIPAAIATGLYDLVVRVYDNLFSGPTTDYILANAFNITTSVWPGDADNNNVADNNDLLPIGLGYGISGNARLTTSIVWQAQSCVDWTGFFSGYTPALNYKYADCNGDGVINAADTTAIIQNFTLTHSKTGPGSNPWRSGIPALVPHFDKAVVYNGDLLTVSFRLGDSSISASHIYGLAFTYNFDPIIFDSAFTNVTFGNSWLGSASDKINIAKTSGGQGQMKIAMARIDHTTRSGNGDIGSASFKITTDNISGIVVQHYGNIGYISDLRIVDSTGTVIPANEGADSNTVIHYPAGIMEPAAGLIQVLPNPAAHRINITSEDYIGEIAILDINGKNVWHTGSVHVKSQAIDISAYEDGLYLVQVKTERGVRTMKLLIAK